MENLIDQLTTLFEQTGQAHHEAFAAVDGADADWPLWYADYLLDKLPPLLGKSITQSDLADLLTQLSKEHAQAASGVPWPRYYAKFFVERYT